MSAAAPNASVTPADDDSLGSSALHFACSFVRSFVHSFVRSFVCVDLCPSVSVVEGERPDRRA